MEDRRSVRKEGLTEGDGRIREENEDESKERKEKVERESSRWSLERRRGRETARIKRSREKA